MTRRGILAVAACAIVVAAAVGGSVWWSRRHSNADAGPRSVPVATATVVRTDLSTTTPTVGHARLRRIPTRCRRRAPPGTVTALPQPGQLISRGQPVYELDGTPVFLFYGARPSWRPLADGVTPGADVLELEQNLTALGYANAANLSVDISFTWATNLAIRRWQQATGQPVTGQLDLGRVVYEPGPIQILSTAAAVGDLLGPGQPVLACEFDDPDDHRAGTRRPDLPRPRRRRGHRDAALRNSSPRVKIDSISAIASPNPERPAGSGGSSNGPSGPEPSRVPAVVRSAIRPPRPTSTRHRSRSTSPTAPSPACSRFPSPRWSRSPAAVTASGSTAQRVGTWLPVTPGSIRDHPRAGNRAGLQVGDKVEVPSQ